MKLPPWHLWGGEQLFQLGGAGPINGTSQVANVNYRRPETWRFLALAEILDMSGPAAIGTLEVDFSFNIGVGRTNLNLRNVIRLQFVGVGATPIAPGQQAWSDVFTSQGLVSVDPVTGAPTAEVFPTNTFPAQSIQVSVLAQWLFAPAPLVTLRCGILLSPNVHVRPDWAVHRWDGGEIEGN